MEAAHTGDGEDRAKLEEQITKLGAGDYIMLTGRKNGTR